MKKSAYCLLAAWLVGGALLAVPAAAGETLTVDFREGHDGLVHERRWNPVRVVVSNRGTAPRAGRLTVGQEFGQHLPLTVPLSVAPGTRKELVLNWYAGPGAEPPTLRFRTGAGTVSGQRPPGGHPADILPDHYRLVGVLDAGGGRPLPRQPAGVNTVFFATLERRFLPREWSGYDALDRLLVCDPGSVSPPLDEEEQAALVSWLAGGGSLVLFRGQAWSTNAAAFWRSLLPDPDVQMAPVTAAADFPCGAGLIRLINWRATSWPERLSDPASPHLAALLGEPPPEADLPPPGRGRSRFMYQPLLPVVRDPLHVRFNASVTGALSLGWILLFVLLYALVIGPLDWFLIRRLKRPILTWLTFLAAAAVFTGWVAWQGLSAREGDTTSVEFLVEDIVPARDRRVTRAAAYYFSDRSRQLAVDPGPADLARTRPGGPLNPTGVDQPYGGRPRLSALVRIFTSCPFFACRREASVAAPLESSLTLAGGRAGGAIRLPPELPAAGALLVAGAPEPLVYALGPAAGADGFFAPSGGRPLAECAREWRQPLQYTSLLAEEMEMYYGYRYQARLEPLAGRDALNLLQYLSFPAVPPLDYLQHYSDYRAPGTGGGRDQAPAWRWEDPFSRELDLRPLLAAGGAVIIGLAADPAGPGFRWSEAPVTRRRFRLTRIILNPDEKGILR